MKATLYGQIDKPVMAIVGVWDPFLPAHYDLFARLVTEAARRDNFIAGPDYPQHYPPPEPGFYR